MPRRDPHDRGLLRSAGRASAVGWELAIAVVGGLLLGRWLDGKLGTGPWLTILGVFLGTAIGFRALFSVLKLMQEEDEEKTDETGQGPDDKGPGA